MYIRTQHALAVGVSVKKSNINYLFLYSKDMNDDSYKIKTKNFLGMV